MTALRAVIFDIDGTLIDSVDFHAKAWVEAFEAFGHALLYDRVRRQIGKGGDQLMPVFLPEAEIARMGKDLEDYRARLLRERYLPLFQPFEGVRALFERVLADGKQVALASSAKGQELERYKAIARIEDLIDAETSSDDAEKSKPHPDIFQAALAKLGMAPEQAIVVGDTPYDAEAAARAGMRTIGVRCGGWSDAELKQAGCTAVYADPADLLARYESSPLTC